MKIQIATCSIFISNNIMHLKPIKNNFFNKHFTKPENKLLIRHPAKVENGGKVES